MGRWRRHLAAVCLALIGAPVPADEVRTPPHEILAQGRDLFQGLPGAAADQLVDLRLSQLPCMSCHRRDGSGADEGRSPAIDGPALARATRDRPPYDRATFHAAITEGRQPGGRELNRLMPRFALTRAESDALFVWLADLPARQRLGVGPDELRLGLVRYGVSRDAAYEAAFRDGLTARLGAGSDMRVHGRRLRLVPVRPGDDLAGAEIVALVGWPVAALGRAGAADLPVLFPAGRLEGDEDPGLVRDFVPSRRQVRRALAREIAAQVGAQSSIGLWPRDGAGSVAMAQALAAAGLAPTGGATADEVVVTGPPDAAAARALAADLEHVAGARLWMGMEALAGLGALPEGRQSVIVFDLPGLLPTPDHPDPRALHGFRAGQVLADVLQQAGRDLTRAGLMDAFRDTWLEPYGLDYAATPLTGTRQVEFIAIGP